MWTTYQTYFPPGEKSNESPKHNCVLCACVCACVCVCVGGGGGYWWMLGKLTQWLRFLMLAERSDAILHFRHTIPLDAATASIALAQLRSRKGQSWLTDVYFLVTVTALRWWTRRAWAGRPGWWCLRSWRRAPHAVASAAASGSHWCCWPWPPVDGQIQVNESHYRSQL